MISPPPSKSSGSSPKAFGAHKKRQLFWDCYTKMASKANNLADGTFCFFKYSADMSKDDTEGDVEVVELTKRQKGMVNGGVASS